MTSSHRDGCRWERLFLMLRNRLVVTVEGSQYDQRHINYNKLCNVEFRLVIHRFYIQAHLSSYIKQTTHNPNTVQLQALPISLNFEINKQYASYQVSIIILFMIFRTLLGKVMSKLADLSPVKNLLKYILDRTLNEFLQDQIQIQDFKDVGDGKLLLLTNISLNRQKINRESLLSSPYILHTGTMGKLKIKLPNLSQLASKSIELSAQELILDLKPNKQFAQNFKQGMKQQQENAIIEQMEEPGEISQSNPLDFFRQLVKQMLLNMVVKFQNIVIRLFINEPSPNNSSKPQYYLMFRVPVLTLGKAEDTPPSQENIECVRFDAVLPQLSVHLLRQGVKYPQFANQKYSPEDVPFKYPTLAHPGTLLLMGKSDLNKQQATKLRLTLTTNYKTQKKDLIIEGRIGSLELTVDPIQLKIITRFVAQLQQFQKIFKSVMIELGLISIDNLGVSRQSVEFTMSRNSSGGPKSNSLDLFTSIIMNINQQGSGKHPNKNLDLYSSIMTKPQLRNSANQFNQEACKQLKKSGEALPTDQGYKNINFKQQLKLSFNLGRLQINLLKYVSPHSYQRCWSIDKDLEYVNTSLGCSHFRGQMKQLNYNFSTGDNKHNVTMKFVVIHDVKLPNPNIVHNQMNSQEFFQIDSNTFYNENTSQDYFTNQPQLLSFKLTGKEHFCMEQLLRVSDGACPNINTQTVRRYAFMPEHASGQRQGLALIFNSHKKILKIEVQEVAVMANFQIWKDALNIIYPIFLYKQLVLKTTINGEFIQYQEETEIQQPVNFSPFESAYVFKGNIVEDVEAKQKPIGLLLEVGLVYCLYRQTPAVLPHQNLISQVQSKVHDYDNFSKDCFCNLEERALYAQVFGLNFQKERENFNLNVKEVKTGFLSLKQSASSNKDIKAFLIVQKSRIEQNRPSSNVIRTRVYLPRVIFSLQLAQLIMFIDMMRKLVGTIDSLQSFKKNLASKIVCIDMQNGTIKKPIKEKTKKQKIIQVYSEQISLKTILVTTCISSLFYKKQGHQQQIKINSFAVGLLNNIETNLAQFRNTLTLTSYPHVQTFSGIDDTSLILELGRNAEPIFSKPIEIDPKGRSMQKLQFFDSLNKAQFSLCIFLKEKTQTFDKKLQEKKFQFKKNPKNNSRKNSVIQEEKHLKTVQILLTCPLHLYLGNAAYLARQKTVLEGVINRISQVLEEIKRDSLQLMMPDRKDSSESLDTEGAEITIKIKGGQIMLDLRPQFAFDSQKNQRILGNTRLIALINLNKLQFIVCSQSKQMKFDSSFNFELFFLHHQDKDIQTNPVYTPLKQLKSLGFRQIVTMGQIIVMGQYSQRLQSGKIQIFIDELAINLCLSTVPALQLFWEHFLKHSIAGNFGIEQNQFEVLEEEEEQLDIINLQQIEELQKKIDEKKQAQQRFESEDYLIWTDPSFKGINLKKFVVARIVTKIYGGNQFKFVSCNSLYQTKTKVRICSEFPDQANYALLMINKLKIQAAIGKETKTLIEFQRMTIDYSFKRTQGIMWKDQKSYILPLLRIERPLKVLLHLGDEFLRVKLDHLELTAGFTDQIFSLADQFSSSRKSIIQSGWKKSYLQQKQDQANKLILLIAPAGLYEKVSKLTINAELKGNKILTERILRIKQLKIHEPQDNSARINQIIQSWVMDILKDNMGTLVTGAFSEVIFKCVELLFGTVRVIVGFFIPNMRS